MSKEINADHIGNDPKVYEVDYHIVPIISEDDLGTRVTAIRDVIERHGGVVIADEYPRARELAYPMTKVAKNKRARYTSSFFGWMKFEALPEGAAAMDKAFRANDEIIRHLMVKTVREDTRAPKKFFESRMKKEEGETAPKEEKPVMSEEEINKAVDELVDGK